MAVSQEKITVHSLADLKNTSDDAIPAYLNSLKFKQSHTLSDVRLAIGYTAFAICAATFCWDYKLGFDDTKYYTAIAVALYTVLNGALTFWIFYVEKGAVYIGTTPSGDKIQISSKVEKHIPIYSLTVVIYKKDHPNVPNTISIKKPFTQWFDKAGHFVPLPFQQMFAGNIPAIGEVDPARVVEAKKKVVQVDDGKSLDEKWASLLAESEGGDSTATTATKGGKQRRKKA